MNEQFNITVAVPTYNGASRLPKLLESLQKQTGVENICWEIIIVDNNSNDNTNEVIKKYQFSWDNSYPLIYYLETKQGAAYARLLAVKKARGKIVAFLDDDNIPATDWLIQSYKFGQEHPKAGAWSGQIHGDFEVQPPKKFGQIQNFLAIREHGDNPYIFDAENLRLPPAAALVIRKKAWEENVPCSPTLTGKLPGLFIQGDDYEPLLYIYRGKWEIWYNPKMHSYHQIPAWRLEKKYLLILATGCGLSTFQLRIINSPTWKIPFIFIKTILSNLKRVISHIIIYKSYLKEDFIPLFEIKFYFASMMSPLCSINLYLRRMHNKINAN
ncbi:MAG: hormogonium polysaccharide biosynthesis glycosyltransferase HpsE [Cyanobacteria bacterium P01_A01_bin.45]